MKKIIVILLVLIIALAGCKGATDFQAETGEEDSTEQSSEGQTDSSDGEESKVLEEPKMQIDKNKTYTATMKTSLGDIELKLFAKDSPKTVNNFVYLAEKGFYDKTIFHRVIKDFMLQAGDPEGTGMGGPGYQFEDEINEHKLVKGVLAMANSGPDTNGSQFFIVTADATDWLDGKHTAFGEVTKGLDVAQKIENVETGQNDKPVEDVVLETIKIDSK